MIANPGPNDKSISRVLLHIIGARRQKSDQRVLLYNRVPELTGCERFSAMACMRRLLRERALFHMGDGRLSKRIALGKEEGGVKGRVGQDRE